MWAVYDILRVIYTCHYPLDVFKCGKVPTHFDHIAHNHGNDIVTLVSHIDTIAQVS